MLLILYIIAIFALISALSGLSMYFVCLIYGIHVREVQIFYCTIYRFKVQNTEIKIGILPVGSYLSPKGYTEEDESPIDEYDLRSKSLFVKLTLDAATFLICAAASILYFYFVVNSYGSLSLIEIFQRSFEISLENFNGSHGQIVLLMFVFLCLFTSMNLCQFLLRAWERIVSSKKSNKKTTSIFMYLDMIFMMLFFALEIYIVYQIIA